MRRLLALALPLLVLAAACGDAASSGSTAASGGTDTVGATESTAAPTKPSVDLPTELPTELVTTDLVAGTGPAAAVGDTVVVNYVGVRSADGTEFDNSYDRGEPFEVTLGAGSVIQGWDQGLVGVQAGGRRQLDIPADLAYGDTGSGDVIKPGDALTFVVDVVAVLPTSDVADEPQVEVKGAANLETLASTELIEGTGATPRDGDTVAIQIIAYRADTGEKLNSSWGGPPITFSYSKDTETYPGIIAVVKGMKVGGRRQAQIPFILMFDGQGSDGLGLPASIDMVAVVDLVAVY